MVRYDPLKSFKVNNFYVIWKLILCDFLSLINSNLGPISHRLAVTDGDDGRTDRRQPYHKLDRYSSTIG